MPVVIALRGNDENDEVGLRKNFLSDRGSSSGAVTLILSESLKIRSFGGDTGFQILGNRTVHVNSTTIPFRPFPQTVASSSASCQDSASFFAPAASNQGSASSFVAPVASFEDYSSLIAY